MEDIRESLKKIDWIQVAILSGLFLLILFLWNFPLFIPIKIFVVILHELSHGLAAVITGGSIHHIEISADIGGSCTTLGGWQWFILMAGYLGSMFWGGAILLVASKTKLDKIIAIVIGAVILIITVFFVRTLFGIVFCGLFGVGMILVGIYAPETVDDVLLKFLGLSSILYAIIDIKEDLISRTVPGSDAYAMSQIIPLPPIVWGAIWIVIAVVVSILFLKHSIVKADR